MSVHDFVFVLSVLFVGVTIAVGVVMWLDTRWWATFRQEQANRMFGTSMDDLHSRLDMKHHGNIPDERDR